MLGYIYHIRNKITNMEYIGCAINFENRKYKHLNQLRKNKHHSWKLQMAYNFYGEDAFEFYFKQVNCKDQKELFKLEIQEIDKFDTYKNGYNCTCGGDGNKTRFGFKDCVLIYQLCKRYDGIIRLLGRYYKCDGSVIANIKNNIIYENENYDENELENLINKIGITTNNLKENYIKHNNRKLTREQCYEYISIITNVKYSIKPMSRQLNIAPTTAKRILDKKVYQDYYQDYLLLTEEEKNNILIYSLEKYKIVNKVQSSKRKRIKNPLTKDQVFYILTNLEKTNVQLAKELNVSEDRISSVRCKKSYIDYIDEYYNNFN